jgi:hypothetical protein
MSLTMSKLAAQIIGLSEDEQAHTQAVTTRLAADPELRSKLEAAEREGAGEGLPAFFPDLAWARLVRDGGAPAEIQRGRDHLRQTRVNNAEIAAGSEAGVGGGPSDSGRSGRTGVATVRSK